MPDTGKLVHDLFERHKLVRRLSLAWAIALTTIVVIRVTEPSVIVAIGAGGASIVVAVIGLFGTVVGMYQYQRHGDDQRRHQEEEQSRGWRRDWGDR